MTIVVVAVAVAVESSKNCHAAVAEIREKRAVR
jgi:hypothetical protein